jgi:hypothetical protein
MPEVQGLVLGDVIGTVVVMVVVGRVGIVGVGTVISGLKPLLTSSCESSGTVPPLRAKVPGVPGVDNGEPIPAVDNVDDGQVAGVLITCTGVMDSEAPIPMDEIPAASKEDVDGDVGVDMLPALPIPTDDEYGETLAMQLVVGAGLRPPGSIEVAPRGMAAAAELVEPGMPRGEDIIPGAGATVCACATPQLSTSATANR